MRRDLPGSKSTMNAARRLGCTAAAGVLALGCAAGATLPSAGDLSDGTPAPSLSWQGSSESGAITTISLSDYYDPDGSKGINALFVDQSAAWCDVCQGLAQQLSQNAKGTWRTQGIHLLTLITQAVDRSPATVDTAVAWKQHFGLDGSAVAADPMVSFRQTIGEQLAPYPYQVIIDPRTLQVVNVNAGWDGSTDFPDVDALAAMNAMGAHP
jgi:hypothetical protein